MIHRLLVWLKLKCECGGWRTVFKKYEIHLGDVTLDNGSVYPVNLHMRPCKKCGRASSRPTEVKLSRGPTIPLYGEFVTYINQETGENDAPEEKA